jgi:hypothetical protein
VVAQLRDDEKAVTVSPPASSPASFFTTLDQRERGGQAGSAQGVTRTDPKTNDPRFHQTEPDVPRHGNCSDLR